VESSLLRAVERLASRLLADAGRDPELREDLRALATAILAATVESTTAPPTMPDEPTRAQHPTPEPIAPVSQAPPAPASPPLHELTLGRSVPRPPPESPSPPASTCVATATDEDLPKVEARCRLKAEGLRWAVLRRRLRDKADHAPEVSAGDREIRDRARRIDCFLWMNAPEFEGPRDAAPMDQAAVCFEAVADVLALVAAILPDAECRRASFGPALDLLAEAQSALRVAVERLDGRKDPDQAAAHAWLKTVAAHEQIYIRRHMRLDDPAPPESAPAVRARAAALKADVDRQQGQSRHRDSMRKRLRYHAQRIEAGRGDDHDWGKIVATVDEMIGGGEPPSSVELRETLLPILDRMPDLDDHPRGLRLFLREVDRYLAARRPGAEDGAPEPTSAVVAEAARLLSGRALVLIGGVRRPVAQEALRSAFGLSDLVWIETREHESIDRFESAIARPEVAAVLLAIRWSSHAFGEVRTFCEAHGKPLVRLPGGYNPTQVARQIVDQCSGRLAGGPAASAS